ncbi:hypothetical protein [Shewanella psychrophila]|uniref:hypothetical protein n=1 Tax=Shewanella psychrophila TaxID=225848 RepID=UPI0030028A5A
MRDLGAKPELIYALRDGIAKGWGVDMTDNFKAVYKAGVIIAYGTDSAYPNMAPMPVKQY